MKIHELKGKSISLQKKQASKVADQKARTSFEFERIFATQLVKELTKDSFKMSDNQILMGRSNGMYRQYITETLASELAKQNKLGISHIMMKYWNAKPQRNTIKIQGSEDVQ